MKKKDVKVAHCLFEQSGTFKNVFKSFGIDAYDYDIRNDFGQTDNIVDLFAEIEKGYNCEPSIFDNITKDDLIVAFFPCTYFCFTSYIYLNCTSVNVNKLSMPDKINEAMKRLETRTHYHELLYKLFYMAHSRGLRMIAENPATTNYLLMQNFFPPTIVDNNRMMRGDYYVKPTAYWFVNIDRTYGETKQLNKARKYVMQERGNKTAGGGVERSMISPDYARNFLNDFVFGDDEPKQLSLDL